MASKFAYRFRKPLAAMGIGVRPAATTADSSVPTITSGTGAPGSTEPAGSVYMRTDSSDAATAIYVMISTTWTAIDGT